MKIIKKYQNRRMYDVAEKKYITLKTLQKLVCQNLDLQIIDVKTSIDITKQTLIQIILEQNLLELENFPVNKLISLISILSSDRKIAYNNFLQESTEHFTNIDDDKKFSQTNDDRLKTNKLTKFWHSIAGIKDD